MILLKQSRNIKGTNKITSLWDLNTKSVWKMPFLIDIHTVEFLGASSCQNERAALLTRSQLQFYKQQYT
jgi:hypothetical protein